MVSKSRYHKYVIGNGFLSRMDLCLSKCTMISSCIQVSCGPQARCVTHRDHRK